MYPLLPEDLVGKEGHIIRHFWATLARIRREGLIAKKISIAAALEPLFDQYIFPHGFKINPKIPGTASTFLGAEVFIVLNSIFRFQIEVYSPILDYSPSSMQTKGIYVL